MRIVTRVLAAIATLVATVAVGLAVTSSPAAASFDQCPSGQACVFSGEFGTGSMTALPFSTYHTGSCVNLNLHPLGGYHSAVGGYGSNYRLYIYHGLGCHDALNGGVGLSPNVWWSGGGSGNTIDSIWVKL